MLLNKTFRHKDKDFTFKVLTKNKNIFKAIDLKTLKMNYFRQDKLEYFIHNKTFIEVNEND